MTQTTLEKQKTARPTLAERLAKRVSLRNPVVLKEMRARMRGWRAFMLLTLYSLFISVFVGLTYLTFTSSGATVTSVETRQTFGKTIFTLVAWLQLLTVGFVAPALTAGSISGEREHQTYDLLRTTLLSARSLVLGKFSSALIFILLMLFAALPIQSLAFTIGGVTLSELLVSSLLLIVTAMVFCAVGVLFSSFLARSRASTVLAYAFSSFLLLGVPMLFVLVLMLFSALSTPAFLNQTPSVPAQIVLIIIGWLLVAMNPMSTAVASEMILLEQQRLWYFDFPITNGPTLYLPSPWILYTLLSLLFSLLLLWLAVRFVKRKEK